jgi:transcriptional regulator with XRE-family HTH domain
MTDVNTQAGKAVARARKKIHLSQEDLARVLNITRTSVSNIERGKQSMSLTMFCKIADILHVSAPDLLSQALDSNYQPKADIDAPAWVQRMISENLPDSEKIFIVRGHDE